jgi:hypothetical protein
MWFYEWENVPTLNARMNLRTVLGVEETGVAFSSCCHTRLENIEKKTFEI